MTDFPQHVLDAASLRYDEILNGYAENEWEHTVDGKDPYSEFCMLFVDVLHMRGKPAEVLEQARAHAAWRRKQQDNPYNRYGHLY